MHVSPDAPLYTQNVRHELFAKFKIYYFKKKNLFIYYITHIHERYCSRPGDKHSVTYYATRLEMSYYIVFHSEPIIVLRFHPNVQ